MVEGGQNLCLISQKDVFKSWSVSEKIGWNSTWTNCEFSKIGCDVRKRRKWEMCSVFCKCAISTSFVTKFFYINIHNLKTVHLVKEGSKGGLRRAGRDGTPIVKTVQEGVELRSLRREGEGINMEDKFFLNWYCPEPPTNYHICWKRWFWVILKTQ